MLEKRNVYAKEWRTKAAFNEKSIWYNEALVENEMKKLLKSKGLQFHKLMSLNLNI